MALTYLLLGSNLGDRFFFFKEAIYAIENEIGKITSQSSIYESAPWGFKHENSFLNQILVIETLLKPNKLLEKTQGIEKKLGRVKTKEQFSERNIDIDILFYNNLVLNTDNLTIPHPQICRRMFTLIPLEELNPDFIHPVNKKTIKQIKIDCTDTLPVRKIIPG